MSLKDWWHEHSDEMFASDDKYKFAEMLWETARREALLDVALWNPEQLNQALMWAKLDQAVADNDRDYILSRMEHAQLDTEVLTRALGKME